MTTTASRRWVTDTGQQVTCIACGETLDREDAREYDKHGDRWNREGKNFEYLCKPCDREYCRQNRDGLEETLIAADAGKTDRKTFLRRFCELTTDNNDDNDLQ
ncbi:hypothetical protein SAMN04487947_3868 [Halogeometricum rufum]|uniref:Small CPxCG-related zinc finger protein n=1 Tax=Halogeometricum rufum TaxID=553469 RepID=A0A1I6IY71_9EURY|nr:hypothetical protein [Halogeometricum rufum]SFR71685.1 hypothetical protein SAMN04487947_3868 [Halogeometricum rufum]